MRGLFIILCFQLAGNVIHQWLEPPVPSTISGMLLFFTYLCITRGGFSPERKTAGQLLKVLPFFFIPAGVGIMTYGAILQQNALPITVALVVGTLLAMLFTGILMQALLDRQKHQQEPPDDHA